MFAQQIMDESFLNLVNLFLLFLFEISLFIASLSNDTQSYYHIYLYIIAYGSYRPQYKLHISLFQSVLLLLEKCTGVPVILNVLKCVMSVQNPQMT